MSNNTTNEQTKEFLISFFTLNTPEIVSIVMNISLTTQHDILRRRKRMKTKQNITQWWKWNENVDKNGNQ